MFQEQFDALTCVEDGDGQSSDADRERVFEALRRIAADSPENAERFVAGLDPRADDDRDKLYWLYEALSKDAVRWANLWVRELDRRLMRAAECPRDRRVLGFLDAFQFVRSAADVETLARLRARVLPELSSPHASLRRAAADLIGAFGFDGDPAARDALLSALHDRDWAVRRFAELSLEEWQALPPDHSVSSLDRLRRKFFGIPADYV